MATRYGIDNFFTDKKIGRRHFILGAIFVVVLTISSLFLANLSPYHVVPKNSLGVEYVRAIVLNVKQNQSLSSNENVSVKILDGQDKGKSVTVSRSYVAGDPNSKRLPVGSKVLLVKAPYNGNQYTYFDRYKIPGAVTIFIVLLVLVIAIGRWRGLTGAAGLVISIGVLIIFVLPRIVGGNAPFATCIEGAFIITLLSIFLAHGFSKRTTLAFVSIIIVLLLMVGLVAVSVHVSGVTGDPGDAVNSEQQVSLLDYAPKHIDLAGLLMGGW